MDFLMILLAALAGVWLGRRLPRRDTRPIPQPVIPCSDTPPDYGPSDVPQVAKPGRIYLRSPP